MELNFMRFSLYIRPITLIFCLLIGVFLFSPNAHAELNSALQAIDKKQWQRAYGGAARLNDFEKDVFNWFAFSRGDPNASYAQIINFMNRYPDWPGQKALQANAERKMPTNINPDSVLSFYQDKMPITSDGATIYVRSLQAKGRMSEAKKFLNDWWPDANLNRKGQQQVFGAYKSSLSAQAHVDRINRLVFKNEYSQAEALAGILGSGYPQLVAARKALRKKSNNVESAVAAVPARLKNNEGLLFDRLQWRRKKDLNAGAIEILRMAPNATQMYDPSLWWKERHIIVRRLIDKRQYQNAYAIASAHKQREGFPKSQAEWVSGFLALRFVNQPAKAFKHFENLYNNVNTPISLGRGAYWAGRASEALNRQDVANQWYGISAKYPQVFYGQLAAKKLGRNPNVKAIGSSGTPDPKFFNGSIAIAARIFHTAGLSSQAKSFLSRNHMNAETAGQYLGAAQAAKRLGYNQIAIKAAQEAHKKHQVNYLDVLYPKVHGVKGNSNGVEQAAVFSIIRQESRFDQRAVSHAGARGLMQLMPGTASDTARKLNVSHQKSWLTSKPLHNIRLGSSYLQQMVQRYGGHYGLAAAAYNAGPGRVDNWLYEFGDPRTGAIDWLDWLELIPIYETRNYAQRVLENIIVYRQLSGGSPGTGYTHMDIK
ncbi:MAG: lytic transglycosylase domain-containing protein [Pseudomonadota bacterium]